jgi:hypothetical protein
MRQHLEKFLVRMGSHHVNAAKHHSAKNTHHSSLAEHYGKLAAMRKAHGDDAGQVYQDLADAHAETSEAHASMHEEHADMAQHCVDLAKLVHSASTNKAAGMGSDFDELEPLPTGFSRVVPDVPGHPRLVARAGGAPVQKALDVPEEFQRTFSTEE